MTSHNLTLRRGLVTDGATFSSRHTSLHTTLHLATHALARSTGLQPPAAAGPTQQKRRRPCTFACGMQASAGKSGCSLQQVPESSCNTWHVRPAGGTCHRLTHVLPEALPGPSSGAFVRESQVQDPVWCAHWQL